jgi:NADPH:quinone reductase-like Zn-dependent oxidoreductase
LGLEASGIIVEKGAAVPNDIVIGDRVAALLAGGAFAQYCVADYRNLFRVPASMSMTHAAAFPEAFCTAFQAVVWHGAKRNDVPARHLPADALNPRGPPRVLIHAGASGVGLACIQVARLLGSTDVFATCSEGKRAACEKVGAVAIGRRPTSPAPPPSSADTAGSSSSNPTTSFADAVKAAVQQRNSSSLTQKGFDLVIDPVFGKTYTQENASLLAPDGGIVVLSFLNGSKLEQFDGRPFFPNRAWIKFSTLRSQSVAYKAALVADVAEYVLPAIASGSIDLNIETVGEGLESTAGIHDAIEENRTVGKAVVVIDAGIP